MGNSIKPHLEHAEKTGVCNLAKQDLPEVSCLHLCGTIINVNFFNAVSVIVMDYRQQC